MPRKRGSKAKGYTNPSGLNISAKQYANLSRTISNYNRRVSYYQKKFGDFGFLPPKVSITDVRDRFTTKQSVTQYMRDLNQMTADNMEIVGLPHTGEAVTKGELNVLKNRIRRENTRRAKIRKLIGEQEENQGFFRTDTQNRYKDIKIEDFKDLMQVRKATSGYSTDSLTRMAYEYKQRYLDNIDRVEAQANIQLGLGNTASVKLNEIRRMVESMNTLEDITLMSHALPSMSIENFSDPPEMIREIDRIYTDWYNWMLAMNSKNFDLYYSFEGDDVPPGYE